MLATVGFAVPSYGSPTPSGHPGTSASPAKSIGGDNGAINLEVSGASLTNITSAPVALTPSFSSSDTDYVWYCPSAENALTLTLTSNGQISVRGQSGTVVTLNVTVASNQAVVVDAPGGAEYWIRCLPPKFPHLTTTGAGPAAYYATGNFGTTSHPGYPMILNQYGTPVWYLTGVPDSAQDVELLPGTHTIEWASDRLGYFNFYNLDTQTATTFVPPLGPFDGHEYYVDPSGNVWTFAVPLRTGYNLSDIGLPKLHAIVDCEVQELSPTGTLLWSWDAAEHVSPDETDGQGGLSHKESQPAADVYHCNSIDIDPLDPNNVLVSMRNVGVMLIDKTTGNILWKLPSLNVTAAPMDGEPVLTPVGDPEGGIIGQHDARFQPNGDISIFDDHSRTRGAARGIEYTVDLANDTATMDWEFSSPSGSNSASMGSVRRYDDNMTAYDQSGAAYAGPDWTVIDWGHGVPLAGFTVLDSSNNVLFNLEFPKGVIGNRAVMLPPSALSLTELRDSAGTALP